jgi:hypothetical protein
MKALTHGGTVANDGGERCCVGSNNLPSCSNSGFGSGVEEVEYELVLRVSERKNIFERLFYLGVVWQEVDTIDGRSRETQFPYEIDGIYGAGEGGAEDGSKEDGREGEHFLTQYKGRKKKANEAQSREREDKLSNSGGIILYLSAILSAGHLFDEVCHNFSQRRVSWWSSAISFASLA